MSFQSQPWHIFDGLSHLMVESPLNVIFRATIVTQKAHPIHCEIWNLLFPSREKAILHGFLVFPINKLEPNHQVSGGSPRVYPRKPPIGELQVYKTQPVPFFGSESRPGQRLWRGGRRWILSWRTFFNGNMWTIVPCYLCFKSKGKKIVG